MRTSRKTAACRDCSKFIRPRPNGLGLCHPCMNARRSVSTRKCHGCGTKVKTVNTTGLCQGCWHEHLRTDRNQLKQKHGAEMARMYREGYSSREIGERFNFSRHTALRILHALGEKKGRRPARSSNPRNRKRPDSSIIARGDLPSGRAIYPELITPSLGARAYCGQCDRSVTIAEGESCTWQFCKGRMRRAEAANDRSSLGDRPSHQAYNR